MLELSERQRKWAAAGVTSLAVALVCAFVLGVGWAVLKILDRASPALVPVMMGFFLSMFFKPYYGWFVSRFRNPTVAFMVMALTVLIPAGLVLWFAGRAMVDGLSMHSPSLTNPPSAVVARTGLQVGESS